MRERDSWFDRQVSPPFLLITGLLLAPAIILQQNLAVKSVQTGVFLVLALLSVSTIPHSVSQSRNYFRGEKYGVYGEAIGDEPGSHGVIGITNGDWGWASGVYGKARKNNAIGLTGWHDGRGNGVYCYSASEAHAL